MRKIGNRKSRHAAFNFHEHYQIFLLVDPCFFKVVYLIGVSSKSRKTQKYSYFCYIFPDGIYLLKINNRNTRTRCEICSKLTIKTSERRQWRRSGVFIANFEHISQLELVFLLLTLNM